MTPIVINFHLKVLLPFVNRPARSVLVPLDVAIPAVKKVSIKDCQAVNCRCFLIFMPVMYMVMDSNIREMMK